MMSAVFRLIALLLAAAPASAMAGKLVTLSAFTHSNDAAGPNALATINGTIYGMSTAGGRFGTGTLFAVDPCTGVETTLYSFPAGTAPVPATLTGANGMLYGTTANFQNSTGAGSTLFAFDPATRKRTTLYTFTGGADGSNVYDLISDGGTLYGASSSGTDNAVFAFDPTQRSFTPLYTVPCCINPHGLIKINGTLHGISTNNAASTSAIFAIDLHTLRERTVHTFRASSFPTPTPSSLTAIGTTLYGTLPFGGPSGNGTLFSIDTATNAFATIYTFPTPAQGLLGALTAIGGTLFGADQVNGTAAIFAFDPATDTQTTVTSFATPPYATAQDFVAVNGKLVGALDSFSASLLFSIDPATAAIATIHSFTGFAGTGNSPLIRAAGALYGTTTGTGAYSLGAVIRVDPATGAQTILHSFTGGADGLIPAAPLTFYKGLLYGTTFGTESGSNSTLFSIDPATAKLVTLYTFPGNGAAGNPAAGLVASHGKLFGTTTLGPGGFGTVYAFDPATNTTTTLCGSLTCTGGAPLVAANGILYGTTPAVPESADNGSLFAVDPASLTVAALYEFPPGTSAGPTDLLAYQGLIYGFAGLLFAFDPATLAVRTVPTSLDIGPVLASGKIFLGSTAYATPGSLFTVDPRTGAYATLYTFTGGADGALPSALVQTKMGFYGVTSAGGEENAGTVFQFRQ